MQLNVEDLGVHMMTIVGHKFGAPKGVAALFISSRVTSDKMCSFFYGGGQEFGRRAGTENVLLVVRSRTLCFVEPANLAASLASAQELCIAGSSWCSGVGAGAQLTCFGCILGYLRSLHLQTTEQEQPSLTCLQAGMGAAAKVVQQELGAIKGTEPFNHPLPRGQLRNGFPVNIAASHMAMLRDKLEARLAGALPKECVRINGPACAQGRLPNTLSISIRGLNSSTALANLADKLDRGQHQASAGAACHSSGGADISGVLKAIGVPTDFAMGTLRLSCGRHTTVEDIDAAAELILKEAAAQGIHVSEAKS
eukprot:1144545-Pelagomonas_calceolata.AAC.11